MTDLADVLERLETKQQTAYYALAELLDEHLRITSSTLDTLSGALDTVADELTCGDCIDGRCHWGPSRETAAQAETQAGREYLDPDSGRPCGCDRHQISAHYRQATTRWRTEGASERLAAHRAGKQAPHRAV